MKKNLNTRQEKAASPVSRQAFKKFNELPQSKPVFFFQCKHYCIIAHLE